MDDADRSGPDPDSPVVVFGDLLGEVGRIARQPEFDTVRARARRLRTRRTAAVAFTALLVLAMLGTAGFVAARPSRDHLPPVTSTASAEPSATGQVDPAPTAELPGAPTPYLRWTGAGDADHLYAVVADCDNCPQRLRASRDGGASWQDRFVLPAPGNPVTLQVVGPTVLLATADELGETELPTATPQPPAGGDRGVPANLRISTDGGAGWRELGISATPVPAAPPTGRIVPRLGDHHLWALDPVAGRMAPLANQPPLAEFEMAEVPVSAGVWVQGYDRVTHRPAVAVSRDGGASWLVRVIPAEPPAPFDEFGTGTMYLPWVAALDPTTAYAMFSTDTAVPRVYRSSDGGKSWQRANPDGPISQRPLLTPLSVVTADGGHMVLVGRADGRFTLLTSRDGASYAPAALSGLEVLERLPQVIDKNHFIYQGVDRIYRSDDGLRWQPLPAP